MANLKKWHDYNKLTLNVKKTKFMHFSGVKKKETFSDIQVELDQQQIEWVTSFKFLRLWLDETLSFKEHIGLMKSKKGTRNSRKNS